MHSDFLVFSRTMTRIFAFLGLVLIIMFYGLVFDSTIASMVSGQYCAYFEQSPCFIPQQFDRWLSIATLLFFLPVTSIVLINWFFRSQTRVSILFGWFLVTP